MDIALDKVCELILRARAIDVKEGVTDPDSGSNAIDDGSTDVLTSSEDDSTEEQVREFIAGLNDDERLDLVAITWIGRGDFEAEEWTDAGTKPWNAARARQRITCSVCPISATCSTRAWPRSAAAATDGRPFTGRSSAPCGVQTTPCPIALGWSGVALARALVDMPLRQLLLQPPGRAPPDLPCRSSSPSR